MKIVKDKIEIPELKGMSEKMFGGLVKAMVDVEKNIMAVDAPMHADLLDLLIEKEGSEPKNLWGINIYPEKLGEDFIEFDSMMNLKPAMGNKTRGVDSEETRKKIVKIVRELIKR